MLKNSVLKSLQRMLCPLRNFNAIIWIEGRYTKYLAFQAYCVPFRYGKLKFIADHAGL